MIIDRIQKIVDYEGISKRSFYAKVGLSNGFLDKPKDVGASKLVLILKTFPYVNPLWLLTGEGQMILKNSSSNTQNITNENGIVSNIANNSHNTTSDNSKEIEYLKRENEHLRQMLEDKEEIIRLLKR